MSPERLPGEAGILQPNLDLEQPALDIVADPNLFDRLRTKWTTFVALGATAVALCASPIIKEQPAFAANTESASIGMPYGGKWSSFVHPSSHPNYSADWATDVYAPPDTEAKLTVNNASGDATYTVSNVDDTSCGAGKRVRVNVRIDNTNVGWVQYEHLDTSLENGDSLQPGSILGKTKNWGNLPCYQVTNDKGVHLHVGMKNAQDNHSCYVDHEDQGKSLNEGTALGVIGSSNTNKQQACAETPGGGGGAPPAWAAADLYEIHNWGAPNGVTDIKELPAAGSYRQWGNGYPTNDSWQPGPNVDYGMGDFNGDNVQDVIKVQHQGTASGMTEARVFNGADRFRAGNPLVTPDGHHGANDVDYAVADYNRDGRPDIYRIMHWNTGSGKTEIRVLDGATNYSTWLTGTFVTPDGWHGGDDVDYVASTCGTTNHPNVFTVLHRNTRNGLTEVKRLDGNANYSSWNGGWDTVDGEHSSDDVNYVAGDCNQNTGLPNIYTVLHRNTTTGHTEVKRMDGSNPNAPYSQWNGGWNTPDGEHSSHDVDFVMAQRNN